jgi:hypothetical protein
MIYEPLPVLDAEQLNAMSEQEYRSYETRCRRAAERQGLRLERSRRRDPRAYDYGTYQLVDPNTNTLAAWGLESGYGLGLADIAEYLQGDTK